MCKDLGNENLAFVLLNRYVDLTEAIEEGNASLLDNSDFAEATNVPLVDGSILPANQVRSTGTAGFFPSDRHAAIFSLALSYEKTTKSCRGRQQRALGSRRE